MPFDLNLKDIETFTSLPFGEYYGEVSAIKYMPPKTEGKNARLQIKYLVLDGEHTGRSQSEFLTMNTGFLVKWLDAFGIDKDTPGLQIDDEDPNTEEALLLDGEPIILGSKIIFSVSPDPKDAKYTRTELQSVEENTLEPAPAAPVARSTAARRPSRVPVAAADTSADDEAADEAPVARTRPVAARRPAATAPRRTLR
jgi:hypothetical protein